MSLLRTPRNPKSPRGFQPLDDANSHDDDDAHIDKSGTTLLAPPSTGRRKKNHFNFLSRSSKKRASAVSKNMPAYDVLSNYTWYIYFVGN
jgi:hypothetical protein